MRVWIVCILIALAGCAGSPESTDVQDTEPDSAPETGNETAAPANETDEAPANSPPVATLNATLDDLDALFNITVEDADGDVVTWSMDADGDGSSDAEGNGSALVDHTYAEAGNHTATLTFSDGHTEDTATLKVAATVSPPPLPGQHAEGEFVAGGALLIGCFGDIVGVGFPAELDGILYASFAIEPHTIGYDYTAAVSTVAQDSPGFAFLDADRGVVSSGFMASHASGTVPEGAALGIWWTCAGGAPVTGTFDSTPPS